MDVMNIEIVLVTGVHNNTLTISPFNIAKTNLNVQQINTVFGPISISNYDSLENVVVIKQKSFFSKKNLIFSYLYSFYKAKNISKNILPDIVHSH